MEEDFYEIGFGEEKVATDVDAAGPAYADWRQWPGTAARATLANEDQFEVLIGRCHLAVC